MTERIGIWLATRSERERRLVAVATVVAVGALVLVVAGTIRDDLATRRARVAALERELTAVRRLAATLEADGGAAGGVSTLARLQKAAETAGLGERIAAMTPEATASGAATDDRVTVRITGASLADTVHLLHALDGDDPAPRVTRFALRKHPDDASRFDLVLEASQRHPAP